MTQYTLRSQTFWSVVKRSKTHNYSCFQCGIDYLFEMINSTSRAYMTGQGRGVKQGDYLLLKRNESVERYQVMMIDYYSSPSDMWIALLERVI